MLTYKGTDPRRAMALRAAKRHGAPVGWFRRGTAYCVDGKLWTFRRKRARLVGDYFRAAAIIRALRRHSVQSQLSALKTRAERARDEGNEGLAYELFMKMDRLDILNCINYGETYGWK